MQSADRAGTSGSGPDSPVPAGCRRYNAAAGSPIYSGSTSDSPMPAACRRYSAAAGSRRYSGSGPDSPCRQAAGGTMQPPDRSYTADPQRTFSTRTSAVQRSRMAAVRDAPHAIPESNETDFPSPTGGLIKFFCEQGVLLASLMSNGFP